MRCGSVVMDEAHLYNAIAYVELNPVRARLVERAEDWRWSSIQAHLGQLDDGITHTPAGRERLGDFGDYLKQVFDREHFASLRKCKIIGRPLGGEGFVSDLEGRFQRTLRRQKPGP